MSYLSSSTNVVSSATSITVTRPAGADASHILVAIVWRDFHTAEEPLNASAGWTLIDTAVHTAYSASQVNMYWALGDVATLVFTAPSASGGMKAVIAAYAGRNLSVPIADFDIGESTGSTISVPSMDATTGADALVGWADFQDTTSLGSAPGGYTDRFTDGTGIFEAAGATAEGLSAGATGGISRTCANFTAKLGAGVLINAAGEGGGGGGGTDALYIVTLQ